MADSKLSDDLMEAARFLLIDDYSLDEAEAVRLGMLLAQMAGRAEVAELRFGDEANG